MSDRNELVSQFSDVTGVNGDQARFYLESAAWELEVALVNYYENQNDEVHIESDNNDIGIIAPSDPIPSPAGKDIKPGSKSTPKAQSKSNSRFATVSSLNRDTSSDEEEGQAFYAGGSEHSGQQVLGPPGKKNNIVAEMFRAVQEHGAEVLDPQEPSSSKRKAHFSGTGYRLGQSSNDSEVIGPLGGTSSSSREMNVTLKMWREGFSVNDGPLRKYTDPENREFLATVGRGEVPEELIRDAHGNEVHVNMEDHSMEEFVLVKPRLKAFSGKGNVLGSPAPTTVIPGSTSEEDKASNEARAKSQVDLKGGEPVTTLQVRLADGSRLVITMNHTHTIADLRNYIVLARPEYGSQNFNLLTTFPSKELSDASKTLADAGILNAAILQRII